jgi:hypothetical protein
MTGRRDNGGAQRPRGYLPLVGLWPHRCPWCVDGTEDRTGESCRLGCKSKRVLRGQRKALRRLMAKGRKS